jgi:F-type H+-transporting ATPase subunit b
MPIDWFTVIAQVINFLVLVWLLKRFLYRPILNAIDAREQGVAAELADADEKRVLAEIQYQQYLKINVELDSQKISRLNELAMQVENERGRLLDEVRLESEGLRSNLQAALKSEQLNLKVALSNGAREEVFAIARQVLGDLADESLEARMTGLFVKRLRLLSADERTTLKSAFKGSAESPDQFLLVRTAFTLAAEQCALIETTIKDVLGNSLPIQFVIEADLISGIELSANGQKVAWSIAEYFSSLTKRVDQLLETPDSQADASRVIPTKLEQASHEKGV